ncbi:50S ribosomal protein L29 [Patescibacteria group bacterium]|nr:50S ribosomal protein L29 [Patescibacteria group bacterium]
MKFKELQLKNDAELAKDLGELREKARELKFKAASGDLKNVKEVAGVKKQIARIMTLQTQRQKGQAK